VPFVPAAQGVHAVPLAPAPYVPAGHVAPHAAALPALTFGGSHGAQDAPSAEVAVPAGHAAHDVLPGEKVPPGHA